MRKKQSLASHRENTFIWYILALAIAAGIFFRLYNLDKKVFWLDETISASHISGTTYEWHSLLRTENPIEVKELLTFQIPNEKRGLKDTIQSLIELEPIHAPLYYCLLYFWAKYVGYSVLMLRLLSALIGLVQIAAIFWLCFELSGTHYLGMLAASLLSLSPILVVYAQETREYSLFAVAAIVLSACFLRAVRKQNLRGWIAYSLCLIFALYTSLLTILVMAGQLIYLLLEKGMKWKQFGKFFAAWAFAFVAYFPWLAVVWEHLELGANGIHWLLNPASLCDLLSIWNANFAGALFDPGHLSAPFQVLMGAVVLVELFAAVEMCRKSSRVAKFVLTLIATNSLPLMILDLAVGGRCSVPPRYQTAATIGIVVLVAYLFYIKLRGKTDAQQLAWRVAFSILLLTGLFSCAICSQATTWREKPLGGDFVAIARIVNEEPLPALLVTYEDERHTNSRQMLVISHLLTPTNKILLLKKPGIPRLDPGMTHFFAYDLPPNYRQYFEGSGRFIVTQIDKIPKLHRVDCK